MPARPVHRTPEEQRLYDDHRRGQRAARQRERRARQSQQSQGHEHTEPIMTTIATLPLSTAVPSSRNLRSQRSPAADPPNLPPSSITGASPLRTNNVLGSTRVLRSRSATPVVLPSTQAIASSTSTTGINQQRQQVIPEAPDLDDRIPISRNQVGSDARTHGETARPVDDSLASYFDKALAISHGTYHSQRPEAQPQSPVTQLASAHLQIPLSEQPVRASSEPQVPVSQDSQDPIEASAVDDTIVTSQSQALIPQYSPLRDRARSLDATQSMIIVRPYPPVAESPSSPDQSPFLDATQSMIVVRPQYSVSSSPEPQSPPGQLQSSDLDDSTFVPSPGLEHTLLSSLAPDDLPPIPWSPQRPVSHPISPQDRAPTGDVTQSVIRVRPHQPVQSGTKPARPRRQAPRIPSTHARDRVSRSLQPADSSAASDSTSDSGSSQNSPNLGPRLIDAAATTQQSPSTAEPVNAAHQSPPTAEPVLPQLQRRRMRRMRPYSDPILNLSENGLIMYLENLTVSDNDTFPSILQNMPRSLIDGPGIRKRTAPRGRNASPGEGPVIPARRRPRKGALDMKSLPRRLTFPRSLGRPDKVREDRPEEPADIARSRIPATSLPEGIDIFTAMADWGEPLVDGEDPRPHRPVSEHTDSDSSEHRRRSRLRRGQRGVVDPHPRLVRPARVQTEAQRMIKLAINSSDDTDSGIDDSWGLITDIDSSSDESLSHQPQRPVTGQQAGISADTDDVPSAGSDDEIEPGAGTGHTGLDDDLMDSSDSSIGENAPVPRSSEYSRELVTQSLRLEGCACTVRETISADRSTGLSMSELTEVIRAKWHVPDVLGSVANHKVLPFFDLDTVQSAPWKSILAGIEEDRSRAADSEDRPVAPLSLCFERSCLLRQNTQSVPVVSVKRCWDIDALILPLTSLAAHRFGFQFIYNPRFTKTLTQSWHTPVGRSRIHGTKCKHLRIGRALGASEFDTYLFFPSLPLNNAGTNRSRRSKKPKREQLYLTREEQTYWIDSVVIPALREVYPQDILQHHPRSFTEASSRSRARQKENVTAVDRSFSELAYFLPNNDRTDRSLQPEDPPDLARLWDAIKQRLRANPLWSDAQLVAVTYGCKTQYRKQALPQLQDLLERNLTDRFDRSFIDFPFVFVDLAYEDIGELVGDPDTPIALLRRTGCSSQDIKSLGLENKVQWFNWQTTSDISACRAEPGLKSALREGGLAYVQAYNVMKDMLAPTDRSIGPLFSEPAFRSLAYSRATMKDFHAISRSSPSDPKLRRRTLKALKALITRVHTTLDANMTAPTGFSTRQEYRISWDLFMAISLPTQQPVLPVTDDQGTHWPFYAFRKTEVLDFIRWQTNRWLYAICAVLSASKWGGVSGRPVDTVSEQHARCAMLSALFSCLELSTNDSCIVLRSRLALDRYHRKQNKRTLQARGASLWDENRVIAVGGGAIRVADGSGDDSGDEDDNGANRRDQSEGSPTASPVLNRRGLAITNSVKTSNISWLPVDMFQWDQLRFEPRVLLQTAFLTAGYRKTFKNQLRFTREDKFRKFVQKSIAAIDRSDLSFEGDTRRLANPSPLYRL